MRRKHLLLILTSLLAYALSALPAAAQCTTLPFQLTNGQVADASQVMANFNALLACVNRGTVNNGTTGQVGYYAANGNTISGQSLSNLLDSAIGSTRGALLERGANGWQLITPGAPGTVLTSNGSGADPGFQTAAAGNRGLFSGQMSGAIPSQVSTGLSTWLNQGTATESDDANGMFFTVPSSGSTVAVRGLFAPAPTPPYTRTLLLLFPEVQAGTSYALFGWYDGTTKLQTIAYNNSGQQGWVNWNSVSSVGSDNPFPIPILEFMWFRVADDGTNFTMSYSYDGVHFNTITSGAKSSGWLGPSGYANIFLGCDCFSGPGHLQILSYQ